MTSSLWYNSASNTSIYLDATSSVTYGIHGMQSHAFIQVDPLVPGEMYRARCNGFGFAYLRKSMERQSEYWDSGSILPGGYSGGYPKVCGNINNNDIVQYIGTFQSSINHSYYKLIKQDEMGYVPVGELTLQHFTEKEAEEQLNPNG